MGWALEERRGGGGLPGTPGVGAHQGWGAGARPAGTSGGLKGTRGCSDEGSVKVRGDPRPLQRAECQVAPTRTRVAGFLHFPK